MKKPTYRARLQHGPSGRVLFEFATTSEHPKAFGEVLDKARAKGIELREKYPDYDIRLRLIDNTKMVMVGEFFGPTFWFGKTIYDGLLEHYQGGNQIAEERDRQASGPVIVREIKHYTSIHPALRR